MKEESQKEFKNDFIAKGSNRKASETHKSSKKIWKRTGGGAKYIKHKMRTSKKPSTASAPQFFVRTQKLLPKGRLLLAKPPFSGQARLPGTSAPAAGCVDETETALVHQSAGEKDTILP